MLRKKNIFVLMEGKSFEHDISVMSGKETRKNLDVKTYNVLPILGCRGFSRVDFLLRNDTDPKVLEINTIPGLTPMSLLPKAAKAYGINYSKLLDRIIASVS